MIQALNAAVRAATEEMMLCGCGLYGRGDMEPVVRAALCAALPAEPPNEVIEAMARADAEITGEWEWDNFPERDKAIYRKAALASYRALRAHLLGEDA